MELPPSVRSNSEEEEEGGGETTVRERCGLCCLGAGPWTTVKHVHPHSLALSDAHIHKRVRAHKHTHANREKKKFAGKRIIRGYHLSLEEFRMSRN